MRVLPRRVARFGSDRLHSSAAYRAGASPSYFARGYRFANKIAAPREPIPTASSTPRSELEAYFDAHTAGPGVVKWQHYFDIYDRHLSRFRGKAVHLVEIGVASGGSLQLWRDYLGPGCCITGVDVDPNCTRFASEGIEILIGDQGDPAFWAGFLADSPSIDIVIDDGGHEPHQQAVTLEALLPRIGPGGVFICEDIHWPFHPFHSFLDGFARPLNDIADPPNPSSALHQQVASLHRYPILTVIEKPTSCPASFETERRGTEWLNPPAPHWTRRLRGLSGRA